jgi:phosphatidylserine decarboxylase
MDVLTGLSLIPGLFLLAALTRKWCLPVGTMAWAIAGATLVAGGVLLLVRQWGAPVGLAWLLVPAVQLGGYLAFLAWRFYRDPERTVPADPQIVVSPADGKVIYIRRLPPHSLLRCDKRGAVLLLDELADTPLVGRELWQVGIAMVFTDVHVNRAPITARVALAKHRPGKFLSLRLPEAINVNERNTVLFDNGRIQIALVQIASRLVRRIVSYVAEGETAQRGQRIGMIKFGSQVDVFLPVEALPRLEVAEGDNLVAGEWPLGRLAVK